MSTVIKSLLLANLYRLQSDATDSNNTVHSVSTVCGIVRKPQCSPYIHAYKKSVRDNARVLGGVYLWALQQRLNPVSHCARKPQLPTWVSITGAALAVGRGAVWAVDNFTTVGQPVSANIREAWVALPTRNSGRMGGDSMYEVSRVVV